MTIENILSETRRLSEQYRDVDLTTRGFRDRIIVGYGNWVLEHLRGIFEHTERTQWPEALAGFLRENWALVNGTALSLTALPQLDITVHLCAIAQFVAEHAPAPIVDPDSDSPMPLIPLTALMPSIAVESVSDHYPEFDASTDIQEVLRTHILGHQGLYLIPVKILTEVDLSPEPKVLTNVYYDYKSDASRPFVGPDEFARLVTHSALTRAVIDEKNNYDTLTGDTRNLLGQLRQLCRFLDFNSANGIGNETNAGGGAYSAIINFMEYYNQLPISEKERVPPGLRGEIDLLFTLVTDPTVNVNATENLTTCIASRQSGIIREMRGHEDDLSAIALDHSQAQAMIHEAEERFNAAKADLNRAISTHQYLEGKDTLGINPELLVAINTPLTVTVLGDLEIIQSLGVEEMGLFLANPALRVQIIDQITSIEVLIVFLAEMPPEKIKVFLRAMIVEVTAKFIQTAEDLSALIMILSPDKCKAVCEGLMDFLTNMVLPTQTFSTFIEHLEPDQIAAVLEAFRENRFAAIRSDSDFLELWPCLPENIKTEMFDAMRGRWNELVQSGATFRALTRALNEEQVREVYAIVHDRLMNPERMNTADDFLSLMEFIPVEERDAFFQAMLNKLSGMVVSLHDKVEVIQCLSVEQCKALYEANHHWLTFNDFTAIREQLSADASTMLLETWLQTWVKDLVSLDDITPWMRKLSAQQSHIIFDAMQEKWPTLLHNESQLRQFLHGLSEEQTRDFCQLMTQETFFSSLFNSAQAVNTVLSRLPYQKQMIICGSIKEQLKKIDLSLHYLKQFNSDTLAAMCMAMKKSLLPIVQSGSEWIKLLNRLPLEQFADICREFKGDFLIFFKSTQEFSKAMEPLDKQHKILVCEALKGHWSTLIKTTEDLRGLRSTYASSFDLFLMVFDNLGDELLNIVTSAEKFSTLCRDLPSDRKIVLYDIFKDKLPELIRTLYDLRAILENLTIEQQILLLKNLTPRLPAIITNPIELRIYMEDCSLPTRLLVYDAVKDWLVHQDLSVDDVVSWLKILDSTEQGNQFYQTMKDHLPTMIKSADDLRTLMSCFYPEEFASLLLSIGKNLPVIVRSEGEAILLFSRINSPEINNVYYQAIKEYLPGLIQTQDALIQLLKALTEEQCKDYFITNKESIASIIQSGTDFKAVVGTMPLSYLASILEVMKDQWPRIIKTAWDFNQVMEYLSKEQRAVVFEAMHLRLFDLIQSEQDTQDVLKYLTPEQGAEVTELLGFLQEMKTEGAKGFATALLGGQQDAIKEQFERLSSFTKTRQKPEIFFSKSKEDPKESILRALFKFSPGLIKKLNDGLQLQLSEEQMASPKDIGIALDHYLQRNGGTLENQIGQ